PLLLSAHCSTHHPPLHSFPTRRSSDLHTTHSQSSRFPSFFDCFRFLSSFWSLFIYPSIYIPLQRKGKKKKNLCGIYIYILFLSQDRKSTRLNSSHVSISYAVFCLKKKN